MILSIAATVGKPVINYVNTGVHDGFLIFLNPKFELEFMFQWLTMFRKQWNRYGQPGSQVNLNSDIVKHQIVNLPSNLEQQKIDSILKIIDYDIDLYQLQLKQYKNIKKSLLQTMFPKDGEKVPKVRFADFHDDWKQYKFKDIYIKANEKNDLTFKDNQIISVANMHFKEAESKSDTNYMKTYNIFRIGDIAFEGHPNKKYKYGRFVANNIGDGIISHIFDVFRPINSQNNNLNYWKYVINNEQIMGKILRKVTTHSTMMNNLVTTDFLKQSIITPSEIEQVRIGNFIKKFDDLIKNKEDELKSFKEFKKFLLQKLFI